MKRVGLLAISLLALVVLAHPVIGRQMQLPGDEVSLFLTTVSRNSAGPPSLYITPTPIPGDISDPSVLYWSYWIADGVNTPERVFVSGPFEPLYATGWGMGDAPWHEDCHCFYDSVHPWDEWIVFTPFGSGKGVIVEYKRDTDVSPPREIQRWTLTRQPVPDLPFAPEPGDWKPDHGEPTMRVTADTGGVTWIRFVDPLPNDCYQLYPIRVLPYLNMDGSIRVGRFYRELFRKWLCPLGISYFNLTFNSATEANLSVWGYACGEGSWGPKPCLDITLRRRQ